MTKYVNKMNGTFMTTDGVIDEKTRTLEVVKDGQVQRMSAGTFKRWWKKVEEDDTAEVPTTEAVPESTTEQQEEATVDTVDNPVDTPAEETATETPVEKAAEKKSKKERVVKPNPEVIDNIINYVLDTAVKSGATVFVPAKDIKMRSLKIDGRMFMAFNYSSKSVVLRCRGNATKEVAPATRQVNHMFDYNYVITEFNDDVKTLIDRLIKVSMDYQIQKNTNSNAKKTKENKEEN
jgi:hypothetical protein